MQLVGWESCARVPVAETQVVRVRRWSGRVAGRVARFAVEGQRGRGGVREPGGVLALLERKLQVPVDGLVQPAGRHRVVWLVWRRQGARVSAVWHLTQAFSF